MEADFTLIPSLLLVSAAASVVALRARALRRLQLLDYAVISIAAIYGLVPVLVLRADPSLASVRWYELIRFDKREYQTYSLLSTLLLFAIVLGWHLAGALSRRPFVRLGGELPPPPYKLFSTTAWVLLLLSLFFYTLYSQAYGGLLGLYEHAAEIRTGRTAVENYWSFLQPFGAFALFSSYLFWGLWLARWRTNQVLIGLILSVLISLLVLVSWLGRLAIVVHLLTLLQAPILVQQFRTRLQLRHYVSAMVLAAAFVLLVYGVGVALQRNQAVPLLDFFVSELGFPLASYSVVVNGLNESRNYLDVLQAPLFVAPTRILQGWDVQSVSDRLTVHVWGSKEFGQLPADMITFCLIEGGVGGVALLGVLWGVVLRMLERVRALFPFRGFAEVMYSSISLSVAAISVLYADPAHLIRRTFYLVFGMVVLRAVISLRPSGVRSSRAAEPRSRALLRT